MSYFGFLAIFLGVPIALLSAVLVWEWRSGRRLIAIRAQYPFHLVLLIHILIAFLYTTPWDNYLVATNVWWYDPELVTGIVFGWVPIEEYTFFIVQPIMAGLWLWLLARRITFGPKEAGDDTAVQQGQTFRQITMFALVLLWLVMVGILLAGWRPGTYMALELGWAIPPLLLQFWFGGHIIWHYRRLIIGGIVPTTLYLAAADALAIESGTWTIDPAQSLNIYLGGVLPVEEFLFFLLTNSMLCLGMTLALAPASQKRFAQIKAAVLSKKTNSVPHV